jgi:hypothetical protein
VCEGRGDFLFGRRGEGRNFLALCMVLWGGWVREGTNWGCGTGGGKGALAASRG